MAEVATATRWRQRASKGVMRMGRALFANTRLQRLDLTTAVYRRVLQFGYGTGDVTTTFRGVVLTGPTNDATVIPGLVGGYYESMELDIFERLVAISRTVVDVGANIGLYCCIAAQHAHAGARIVAFEPVPENLDYLRRNIAQNDHAVPISIEEMAVGEANGGELELFLANSIGTHSASSANAGASTDAITVPMISLDAYAAGQLAEQIDVLKIDVEGYEVAVLRGAATVLRGHKPTLFIEFLPKHIANCGASEVDLLDIVFGAFTHVFVLDEPRATLKPCTKDSLLHAGGAYKNANLVATANPAHLRVIESLLT